MKSIEASKLKDLNKAQILYDALMIVTNSGKYGIKDTCIALQEAHDVPSDIKFISRAIVSHMAKQGY